MPFDVHDFPAASRLDRASTRQSRRLVAIWLFTVAGMIMVMIILGGATRLTGSGLSIMEWAPLMGALPPLSDAEWQRMYGLYRQIPQYSLVNEGFGLQGFKHIFWLEWTHRLWGRLIGLAFLAPLAWFALRGSIDRRLAKRLGALFLLGGLQGAIGWFMVASGFAADSTAVSPYRLVIHLAMALMLYAAILWTALSLWHDAAERSACIQVPGLRLLTIATCGSVGLTILAGGFVAGLRAGLTYNTFPLMDGSLVPEGYAQLHPLLRNLTENVAAVQFDHRTLASLTAILALATVVTGLRKGVAGRLRAGLIALGATVAAQYILGVTTLLWVVPVSLGTAHQAMAVLVLTAAMAAMHAQVKPGPINASEPQHLGLS